MPLPTTPRTYFRRNILASALLGLTALSAHAATISFTDQATWSAAAGPSLLETFSSAPLGTSAVYGPTAFNGFTVSATNNGNGVVEGIANGSIGGAFDNTAVPGSFNGQNFFGWGNIPTANGNTGPTITITFGGPIFAFGFDWFNTDQTDRYKITLSDGTTLTNPPFIEAGAGAASGFYGVTSDIAITSLTISSQTSGGIVSTEGFDNFRTSGSSSVPDGGTTAALLGLALGGIAAVRRKLSVV